jgi:small-conductance mechanosensitive channel
MNPAEWVDYEILGNPALAWGTGFAVFVGTWLALGVVRRVLHKRLRTLAERRQSSSFRIAEQVVGRTKGWLLFLLALFIGSRFVQLPAAVDGVLLKAVTIGSLLQMGLWASAALTLILRLRRERQAAMDPDAVAAIDVLGFVVHVAVWSLVLLLAMDNLGYEITALLAGLGVGGIAVALATQNILGDLFASLSIVLDKPFAVGDFLVVGDFLGSVEKVGIKTTRLRSLSGEQLVFSNNDLLSSRIRNYGRMYERRVLFTLGVTYQTPADKLKRIPAIVREAIEMQESVRFDRAHFQKYGDFALIFEIVYYVLSPDFNLYMDIHQAVNLFIYERFAEEEIEFAYPTQTLYVTSANEAGA